MSVEAASRWTCEAPVVELELAIADHLGDGAARLVADDQAGAAGARRQHVDVRLAGERVTQGRRLDELGRREGEVVDVDDGVRARGVGPGTALGVEVEPDAGPPAGAAALVVAGQRLDDDVRPLGVETAGAGERIADDLPLELALVSEVDVAELRPARPVDRVDLERRGPPHVRAAVLARLEDPDRVGAPERLLAVLGDARHDAFAGQGVRDEDHPAVESGDRDPPVCDARHVQFDLSALHVSHASSLTGWSA